ncbi:phosphotransferase (plasmid) [Bosea sp. F3-2]|uniref:phosphotransferase n=1 Tax=Bosea sp. F3-2 TaxID=2599640 RepID=UPI0011EF05AF|nr:phosphotransferase [Bosea sp. F3-2]QEL26870.1 phosphotransferase [Bosea sp. F3-2]
MSGLAAPALDDALMAPLPQFAGDELAAMLREHFGISGSFARISGERDLNLHVACADGQDFVFKVCGNSESVEELAFQNAALTHLARTDPALPVPRVVAARDGSTIVAHESGGQRYLLRVLTYLPGEPVLGSKLSRVQRVEIGMLAARLDRALADFEHPAANRAFIWDLVHVTSLREKIAFLDTDQRKATAARVLDRFTTTVGPLLPALPRQVVHNDLNQANLLLRPQDGSVSGIIDFGDMIETIRVAEVAIASAHLLYREADPMSAMAQVVKGYARLLPLEANEIAVLPVLVQARLATRELIVSWRRQANPAATTSYRDDVSRFGWEALARCDAVSLSETAERLAEAARLGGH